MRRRFGQVGAVVKKGNQWHIRYRADLPDGRRTRKSVLVGPAIGKDRLTKAEAARKGAELIAKAGVNTSEHLERAMHPETREMFKQRVDWARRYHKAWTHSKPGTITAAESHLTKHLLPRFGSMLVEDISERRVQEFVADLSRTVFEMKKPNGDVIKRYRLSRKTIANVIGILKLILGRRIWKEWEELDLGSPTRPRQRYFTEEQLKRIIEAAPGFYKPLFALLAGTGMRIGEAAGLNVDDVDLQGQVIHIRRGIFNGKEITPKTDAGFRDVDIDDRLTQMLKDFIGERKAGRLFASRKGTPLAHGNIRTRVLTPLLEKLGIPKAGLHAFRHSRVTILRKAQTPDDLQKRWLGHSSLAIGDRYNHASEEAEYRQEAVRRVGLDRVLGPNGPNNDTQSGNSECALKPTA